MRCKDIPEEPVLRFLHEQGGWCTWFGPIDGELPANSVLRAMPHGTPAKLALAKMRQMIRNGLVDGCGCGCRGDFELTYQGRELVRGTSTTTPLFSGVVKEVKLSE